jgi:dihydropteroate synthase
MGVLNVTPDSFFDGGRYLDHEAAIAHGLDMVSEGADIVDVGGESTRPGAEPVDEQEELRRVVPVVAALAPAVRISVDTTKPAVARAAVEAGATLINDVSARIFDVAASTGAGYVAIHMQGTPRDMQHMPHYDDVVGEVRAYLRERAQAAGRAGVEEVWVDPGIGFGKSIDHNLALLAALPELADLGWPVLVGTSRKSFLGRVAGRVGRPQAEQAGGQLGGHTGGWTGGRAGGSGSPGGSRSTGGRETAPPDERLEASIATAVFAVASGASMVRVHDVRATVAAVRIVAEEVGA